MENEVRVTEIQIVPVKPKDGLIAFASFVLDGRYYVNNVAVFTRLGAPGYRLVYPTKKVGTRNINHFHPISSSVGAQIEIAVAQKVNELFNDDLINYAE